MLTIPFWNLNGRNREALCAGMAHDLSLSVVALAECPNPSAVLAALNPATRPAKYYLAPTDTRCRVRLFTHFPSSEVGVEEETTRYTIRRVVPRGSPELLLVAAHERSKRHRTEGEQNKDFRDLARTISDVERRRGHTRTVLVGDLNADPFQEGVFAADGLHGVPTRAIAAGRTRVVDGKEYAMFYNPMWRFFGDARPGPPGTYYRRKSESLCRFWHVFDQVLVRPELLPLLDDQTGLAILDRHREQSLKKPSGLPDPEVGSDHFPILLRLNYPGA